jgi:hypothetical protein
LWETQSFDFKQGTLDIQSVGTAVQEMAVVVGLQKELQLLDVSVSTSQLHTVGCFDTVSQGLEEGLKFLDGLEVTVTDDIDAWLYVA